MLTFIETKLFTRLIGDYMSDEEYLVLQNALMANPEAGDLIRGSGGVRKVRWSLTGRGKRGGRRSMAKTKRARNVGLEILDGIRQIKRGEHGRITNVPSVALVRETTGLSQSRFAELLGVSVRTLQEWEQGRRAPSGAARTLLMIAAKNPRALLEVA